MNPLHRIIMIFQAVISLNVNIVVGKVRCLHNEQLTLWDHLQVMFLPHLFVCLHTPVNVKKLQENSEWQQAMKDRL